MTLRDALEKAHQVLQDGGVDHALVGGFALAAHGVARTTNDIDFLVGESQKEMAKNVLTSCGWVIELETAEVIHFAGPSNLDLLIARRPLSQEMLVESRVAAFKGIKCVSAEGIIGLKIQAYKNDPTREFQDRADIQSLIAKFPNLRWDKVREFADLFGEWGFIEMLRKRQESPT